MTLFSPLPKLRCFAKLLSITLQVYYLSQTDRRDYPRLFYTQSSGLSLMFSSAITCAGAGGVLP